MSGDLPAGVEPEEVASLRLLRERSDVRGTLVPVDPQRALGEREALAAWLLAGARPICC